MRISDWSSDVCSSDLVELVLDASGKIERLVADAVLCTVLFSVIGDISFDPPLSEDKRQVIAQLHYAPARSEEHTSELQSLMRNSYAVFRLKKKKRIPDNILIYMYNLKSIRLKCKQKT